MTRRQLAKQEELSKSQRLPDAPVEPVVQEEAADVLEENQIEDPVQEQQQVAHDSTSDEPVKDEVVEPQAPQELSSENSPVDSVIEEAHAEPEKAILEQEVEPAGSDQQGDLTEPPTHKDESMPVPQQTQEPEETTIPGSDPETAPPQVEVTCEPEPKTLTSDALPEVEQSTTPIQSPTPSRSASKSPARTPMRLEQSIEAIDALEEALENVIPNFNPEELSPKKARFDDLTGSNPEAATEKASASSSRVSKAPAAPKSMKPGTSSRPSVSARPSMARSSSVRNPAPKEARKGSAEVKDYLASKRRPISISFPTPPPPPKATKPPTKSNFQLPGEAVAAKLKAQKEERLKREQEAGKDAGNRRPVSATYAAPPPVRSSKPPTKPNFQLPGEAVAAKLKAQKEERLKREAQGLAERPASATFQPPPPPKSSKPPTVPNFQLPGEAVAAKLKAQREERLKREEEDAAKKEKEKAAFKARPVPVQKGNPVVVRQTSASRARESLISGVNGDKKENGPPATIPPKRTSSLTVAKRGSTVVPSRPVVPSSSASSRASSFSTTAGSNAGKRSSIVMTKATVTPVDAAALRQKGREVYNRDKIEKERLERERKEKEEAAKRARAEAAERGRIASREWAEKQRKKMMAAAAAAKTGAA
jgi:hypothetical protein